MDVTILKLDLGDAEFNAPFAAGEVEEESDDEENGAGATPGDGVDPTPVVVIAVLVGLAVLGWYLRSGDDAEVGTDELEVEKS
ncbi:MAG: hypothetical protein ABEH88_10055 [Halobacteriales archaeon]